MIPKTTGWAASRITASCIILKSLGLYDMLVRIFFHASSKFGAKGNASKASAALLSSAFGTITIEVERIQNEQARRASVATLRNATNANEHHHSDEHDTKVSTIDLDKIPDETGRRASLKMLQQSADADDEAVDTEVDSVITVTVEKL